MGELSKVKPNFAQYCVSWISEPLLEGESLGYI